MMFRKRAVHELACDWLTSNFKGNQFFNFMRDHSCWKSVIKWMWNTFYAVLFAWRCRAVLASHCLSYTSFLWNACRRPVREFKIPFLSCRALSLKSLRWLHKACVSKTGGQLRAASAASHLLCQRENVWFILSLTPVVTVWEKFPIQHGLNVSRSRDFFFHYLSKNGHVFIAENETSNYDL